MFLAILTADFASCHFPSCSMVMIWPWWNCIIEQSLSTFDFWIEGYCLLPAHLGSHGEQTVAACSDQCVGRGVSAEGVKFNIVTNGWPLRGSCFLPIGRDQQLFLITVWLVLCETSSVLVPMKGIFPWLLLAFQTRTEICELFLCCCRPPWSALCIFCNISSHNV